jgi:hypothetical protein
MKSKPLNNKSKGLGSSKGLTSKKRGLKFGTTKNKVKRKEDRECFQEYFKYHVERCVISDESKNIISGPGVANIAHLLPKQIYKSVMCEKINAIYLALNEHGRFDYLLGCLNFQQIEIEFKNSWPIACERYLELLPLVKEEGELSLAIKKYLNYEESL